MCYCRCKECGWNDTHNSGFHAACKSDPGTFALPDDHGYWKPSRKNIGVSTGTGDSEGNGLVLKSKRRSDLSEVVLQNQGEVTDETFYYFLTDFSKVLDNLKEWGISY